MCKQTVTNLKCDHDFPNTLFRFTLKKTNTLMYYCQYLPYGVNEPQQILYAQNGVNGRSN